MDVKLWKQFLNTGENTVFGWAEGEALSAYFDPPATTEQLWFELTGATFATRDGKSFGIATPFVWFLETGQVLTEFVPLEEPFRDRDASSVAT